MSEGFKKTTTLDTWDGMSYSVEADARDDWSFRIESPFDPGLCQERAYGVMETKERAEQTVDVIKRIMRDEPLVEPVVRVGVAAWIYNKDGEVLMGKRKGSHGAGTWSLPGGHVDFGEEPMVTVPREIREETGLEVGRVQVYREWPWGHRHFPADNKQYVTLFFTAEYIGGEPRVMEPSKCECWEWFTLDALPSPLFGALDDVPMIEALRKSHA